MSTHSFNSTNLRNLFFSTITKFNLFFSLLLRLIRNGGLCNLVEHRGQLPLLGGLSCRGYV